METDITKIKNYAKEKEDENWEFRNSLKGCDDRKIDLIVHKLFKEISASIDCTVCGNCCKKMQPTVTKWI